MALLVPEVILTSGLSVQDVYVRTRAINGSKDDLEISMDYYISQTGFSGGRDPLYQKSFIFTPSVEDGAENFIKQGYEHLKTLEEFEAAVDV